VGRWTAVGISGVSETESEDRLVECAQAGDRSAFERLYRTHAGRVFAVCRRLTGSAAEAEDMTQETFIRAWQNLRSFRRESRLSSWLHRVAVNVVLNDRRTRRRALALEHPGEGAAEAAASGEGPRARWGSEDLERAIGALPEGARIIFVLHDVYGYAHGEISKMAGCAVGTSKAQLHRARVLLRRRLES
jgi:RNA polymerase sigma-70 factor (ECF subfamily)